MEKTIYSLLFALPFLMGTVYGIVNLAGGWAWLFHGHNYEFYYHTQQIYQYRLISFFLLSGVAVGLSVLVKLFDYFEQTLFPKCRERQVKIVQVIAIFLVAIAVRMVLILVFKGEIHPYSDFAKAWERANGDMTSLPYYSFFPGYINYSLFEKVLSMISGANYDAVISVCAFWNGITSVFIFLIGFEIFQESGMSVLSALLYAFNPSQIVYTLTSTPEHMAIACFSGSVYCLCKWHSAENGRDRYVCILVAGILGGIGSSVKTFFPVIVFAFFITVCIGKLLDRTRRKGFRSVCMVVISIILLYAVQYSVMAGISAASEKVFDVKLDYSDATPHYFNVGLNRQGEGQIHVGGLSRLYIQDRNNGIPLEEAKVRALERVLSDWEEHQDEIPEFFVKKSIWAWQDDYVPISYFLNQLGLNCSTNIERFIYNGIEVNGASYSQVWYICSMLFGIIGVIIIFREKRREFKNMGFLLTNLLILGYFCITVVSEAQSRYKCLCIPYICIIDAYAIVMLSESFSPRKIIGQRRKYRADQ